MERRNITPQENVSRMGFVSDIGYNLAVFRESSPVDEFYFEKCSPSDCKDESVSVVDPIIMLFNQQRLDNMGPAAVTSFLDSLAQKSNALSELRKKCSDDDLMKMVKSRHLQSPSEILAWCRYIESNVDSFNEELKVLQEQQQQETLEKTSVEPTLNS